MSIAMPRRRLALASPASVPPSLPRRASAPTPTAARAMPSHACRGTRTPSSAQPKIKTNTGVAIVTTDPSTADVRAVPANCKRIENATATPARSTAPFGAFAHPSDSPRSIAKAVSATTPSARRRKPSVAGGIAANVSAETTYMPPQSAAAIARSTEAALVTRRSGMPRSVAAAPRGRRTMVT